VQRARSEAIHRNARVLLCKSVDGASCATTGGYEQGWIVFQDANSNAALDAGEAVIQVQQMPPGPMRLYGNGPVSNYISFTGMGLPKMLTGEFQAGTLTVCCQMPGQVQTRRIVLSKPGNVRLESTEMTQCG
jgi:type IV fimbrial biogenesis protein FimT